MVETDRLALGNIVQAGQLEGLIALRKVLPCFLAAHFPALKLQLPAKHLAHLFLNRLEVFRNQPVTHVKVVVKALVRRRTDVKLDIRI